MRLRELQGVADNMAQKAVAWPMRSDLELCAELPDGVIRMDLLRRNSEHSTSGAVELRSVSHLRWWLRKRMRVLRIPRSELTVATVVMEFRTDRILTNRAKLVSFDWQARTQFSTQLRAYEGRLAVQHIWHSRPCTSMDAEDDSDVEPDGS